MDGDQQHLQQQIDRKINLLVCGITSVLDEQTIVLRDCEDDHYPVESPLSGADCSYDDVQCLSRSLPFNSVDDRVKLYIWDHHSFDEDSVDSIADDFFHGILFICSVIQVDTINQMISRFQTYCGVTPAERKVQVSVLIKCCDRAKSNTQFQENLEKIEQWSKAQMIYHVYHLNTNHDHESALDTAIKGLAVMSYSLGPYAKIPQSPPNTIESGLVDHLASIKSPTLKGKLKTLEIMVVGGLEITKSFCRSDAEDCHKPIKLVGHSSTEDVTMVVWNAGKAIKKETPIPDYFFSNLVGIYLCYDPFHKQSVSKMYKNYHQYIKNISPRLPIVVVAVKTQAPTMFNQCIFEENYYAVDAWCKSNNIGDHILISEKYNINIDQSFHQLALKALQYKLSYLPTIEEQLNSENNYSNKCIVQ